VDAGARGVNLSHGEGADQRGNHGHGRGDLHADNPSDVRCDVVAEPIDACRDLQDVAIDLREPVIDLLEPAVDLGESGTVPGVALDEPRVDLGDRWSICTNRASI
jgi:hypothetical protein